MTIEVRLKDGSAYEYKYGSTTWDLFLWSIDHYGGIRGKNIFIAADQIATMRVKGKKNH